MNEDSLIFVRLQNQFKCEEEGEEAVFDESPLQAAEAEIIGELGAAAGVEDATQPCLRPRSRQEDTNLVYIKG